MNTEIMYLGKTNYHNEGRMFGIRQKDRLQHLYIIGKTGTGKSTLIHSMFMQDVFAGRGACLIDIHGDLVESVMANIPEYRKQDVIYFNVPDMDLKLRYNPMKHVSYHKRSLITSAMLEVFKMLSTDSSWGFKLEYILRNTILALLDLPVTTIADIPKMLTDREFRKHVVSCIKNESVKRFWQKEFPNYSRYDLLPVLNKMGGMLAHPVIRKILVENPEEISIRKAIDDKRIILFNISKGILGEDVARILASFFLSTFNSAAFSRAEMPEELRTPYMLYADEFQNYVTDSFVSMLSEIRKLCIGLTIANQYSFQVNEEMRRGIFGNVGTIISFRVGVEDAHYLMKEMPVFTIEDFTSLPNYHIYLKLVIDGSPSKPFSATTMLPINFIEA